MPIRRGYPTFVQVDIQISNINAIQKIWPYAIVSVCYFHANQAINNALRNSAPPYNFKSFYRSNLIWNRGQKPVITPVTTL